MRHSSQNSLFYSFLATLIVLGLVVGAHVFGWIPADTPSPGHNVSAPLNSSATNQSKIGYLAIGTSTAPQFPPDMALV